MKLQKIAAIISAAALALALTGCGNDTNANDLFGNNSQNVQSGGTTSKPAGSKPASLLPDIPVTDASAFEYKYDSELGGVAITNYKAQSFKLHIPDTIEGEKVVAVYLDNLDMEITQIIMPDSVKDFKFSESITDALQFVNIPNGVTEIGEDAFSECKNLKSITIPNGVTEIGSGAFSGCASLTSITIPDSVTEIGGYAFSECTSLTSVTIPDSVTEIGEAAFTKCTSLTSITIPNGVTKIGLAAFYECTSLTSITIPNGVTKIGGGAFNYCVNIKATYKGKTYDYEHIEDLYKAINGN